MHTGRRPGEGRHQGDASTSHGLPEIASKPLKLGDSHGMALRRSQPCRYLDLRLLTSRTVVDTHPVVL